MVFLNFFYKFFRNEVWTIIQNSFASFYNYPNQKSIMWDILQNTSEAALIWKLNVLSVWKWNFWIFSKFFSDEVELFSG